MTRQNTKTNSNSDRSKEILQKFWDRKNKPIPINESVRQFYGWSDDPKYFIRNINSFSKIKDTRF